MKPFRFSLEFLRVMRQQKEQAAQQRYVAALTGCREAEHQWRQSVLELDSGWILMSQELGGGVAASRLACLRAWCKVLEIRKHDRQSALDNARRAASHALAEMTSASRDRESLDRFYDKSRLAHERETQRAGQKDLDELAVQLDSAPGPLQFTGRKN